MTLIIVISIVVGLLCAGIFLTYVYFDTYIDSTDILYSTMIFFLGFLFSGMIALLIALGLSDSVLYENTNIDSSMFSVTSTHNIEKIERIDDLFEVKDDSSSSNSLSVSQINTFFIPWNEKNSVIFVVEQKQNNFLRPIYKKYFVYVPQDKYADLIYDLSVDDMHTLDETFINPKEVLNNIPISIMESPTKEFNMDGSKKSLNETSSINTYDEKLIESKPIFKYDIKNGIYTIRYNDGTLLDINSAVVEIKIRNEEQMYIDKIQVTVPDINGNETSYYKYQIYK